MPSLADISIPLEPGKTYHIFNRGNEGRKIFFQHRNYSYFLDKYVQYMSAYWDTHAFCLLANHFHLAVALKNRKEILEAGQKDFGMVGKIFLKEHLPTNLPIEPALLSFEKLKNRAFLSSFLSEDKLEQFLEQLAIWAVSERFRRLLLGYAKAINAQEKRNGSLFQKPFRRKLVKSGFSKSLVAYIHRNPVHHSHGHDLSAYPWSSYNRLLSQSDHWLAQDCVLAHFGGNQAYQAYHQQKVEDWLETKALIIEE